MNRRWIRKVTSALGAVLAGWCAVAAEEVRVAPLNPQVIQWVRANNPDAVEMPAAMTKAFASGEKDFGLHELPKVSQVAPAGGQARVRTLGRVPTLVDYSYLRELSRTKKQSSSDLFAAGALPENFDLRTENRVTSVKDQNPYGTCWAHATMGAIESFLRTNKGGTFNFSEKHLANTHGRDWGFDEGGNGDVALAYLSRLSGPIDENEDPYPGYEPYYEWARKYNGNTRYIRELKVSKSPVGTPLKQVLNAVRLAPLDPLSVDTTRLNAIKEAVRTYGALYTGYTHIWGALTKDEVNFFWNGDRNVIDSNGGGGHAVLIVGWDDNYPKSKFKHTPPGNGAFIVKNSWGTSVGENGYQYFSYYDYTFGRDELYSFRSCEPAGSFSGVYEHDPLGVVTHLSLGSDTAYGANMFTARKDESLAAVGVYANAPDTTYAIDIYMGCTASKPTSGTKVKSLAGTLDAGFSTVSLGDPLPVTSGTRFSVVIKLKTPGYSYPLAVEYYAYVYDYIVDPTGKAYDMYGTADGFGDFYTDDYGDLYCHYFGDDSFLYVDTSASASDMSKWEFYYTDYDWSDMSQHRNDLTSGATASPGESFYSSNGTSWTDFTKWDSTASFCGKVYTVPTKPDITPTKSDPVTDLSADLNAAKTAVELNWDYEDSWAEFYIYKSTTPTKPDSWYRFALFSPTFTDTSITKGTTYYYWVTAKHSGKEGEWLESDPVGPIQVSVPEDGPAKRPDIGFDLYYDLGWSEPMFLTASYGGKSAQHSFVQGSTVYINSMVGNEGEGTQTGPFIIRFEVLDASGNVLYTYDYQQVDKMTPGYVFWWKDATWGAFDRLGPGNYTFAMTIDPDNEIDDSDRSNNYVETDFKITSTLSLASAVDYPDGVFTTGGVSDWYGWNTDSAVQGGAVARSASLSGNGSNWMQLEVDGAGVLEFSAVYVGDGAFICSVDGREYEMSKNYWCGQIFDLTESGLHTIRWTFTSSSSSAYAMVDAVSWRESPPPEKPELYTGFHVPSLDCAELDYRYDTSVSTECEFYRAESSDGAKTKISVKVSGLPNGVYDETGDRGKVYWYWLRIQTAYGEAWSDPVRAARKLSLVSDMEFPVEGVETNFNVGSSWSATASASWIRIPYASSDKSEPLTVVCEANATGAERRGTLTVLEDGRQREYEIVQLWHAPVDDFEIVDGVLVKYNGAGGDIVIPNTVTNIAKDVFRNKGALTSVVIPDSVLKVSETAFYSCQKLSSVSFGKGLIEIGAGAFQLTAVASLDLPDSLLALGANAFNGCTSLTDVSFGNGIVEIGNSAFYGCTKLSRVDIPAGVSKFGTSVFASCTTLVEARFANELNVLPQNTFARCVALTNVDFSAGVYEIGVSAFDGCSGLKQFRIPVTVTNIQGSAFMRCTALESVIYAGDAPKVAENIYNQTPVTLVSKVPYDSTGWDGTPGSDALPSVFPSDGETDARAIIRGQETEVVPEPPTALSATGSSDGITLAWVKGRRAMTYSIYRAAKGGVRPDVPMATGIAELAYFDETCEAGVDYDYWVESVNLGGTALCDAPASAYRLVLVAFAQNPVAMSSEGGEMRVGLVSNAYWEYDVVGEWLEVEANGEVLILSASKNDGGLRSATVMVHAGGDTPHPADFTLVVQQAAKPSGKVATPVITPVHGTTFSGQSCIVSITCETPGAEIYFRIDGLTPRPSSPYRYGGEFEIYNTAEIVAFAAADGMESSDFAEATISWVAAKEDTLPFALDIPRETVESEGEHPWFSVVDASAVGGRSARSGRIGMNEMSCMTWTTLGAGTITFKWRSECEHDPRNRFSYDRGVFSVDGVGTNWVDGVTDGWRTVTLAVEGEGEHEFSWEYVKDDYDMGTFKGEDCVWVDQVVWTLADRNLPTDAWWEDHLGLLERLGRTWAERNLAAQMESPGADGNGKPKSGGGKWLVWEDYVAGTDPESDKVLRVTIRMEGEHPVVEWCPDNVAGRQYILYGNTGLAPDGWKPTDADGADAYNFFKVSVEMK